MTWAAAKAAGALRCSGRKSSACRLELFRERPKIVDGFMAVPDTPSLGLELREDTLEKYGVRLG